jgi:thioredoxin 1
MDTSTNGDPMLELNEASFDQQIARGTVVVDFTAQWCPRCRLLEPQLNRAAEALREHATFAKVDADDNPQLLARYRIEALPTIVIFQDGQPLRALRGLRDEKTLLSEIRETISAAI